jgi:hypothetical protein
MMKEKFEKEGLSIIRDSFTYRNLCGKQVRCGRGDKSKRDGHALHFHIKKDLAESRFIQ